jgi:acetylglutamate kinase
VSRLVVKVGGAVAAGSAAHDLLRELVSSGRSVCVVHGGGPQITAAMAEYDLPVEFVNGRRVTTPAALVLVRRALAGVNADLCATIGPRAVGLLGDEIGLPARPVPELGRVGTPLPSSPPAVVEALAAGLVPVVAPLAAGPLNVNADEAAAALAVGLHAERLLFLSDVPGLLRDGAVVPRIAADEATRMLDAGELEGGIVPKLRAAVTAARLGVTADIGETAVVA